MTRDLQCATASAAALHDVTQMERNDDHLGEHMEAKYNHIFNLLHLQIICELRRALLRGNLFLDIMIEDWLQSNEALCIIEYRGARMKGLIRS